MSYADFIKHVEDSLIVLALLGAIWSAYSFVRSKLDEREEARQLRLRTWRKASIQKMLNYSPDWLTTKQITDNLRSSSFDADFDIEKSELTEQSVRLVLLQMVEAGLIYQVYGDFYGLQQFRPDPAAQYAAESVQGMRAFRQAFNKIVDFPGHYSDERLFDEVGVNLGLSKSDFILAIYDLKNRGLAKKDQSEKWWPDITQEGANQ